MIVRLEYEETPYLKVSSISVIGSFNGYDADKNKMVKSDGIWYVDILLSKGEYRYKFFINDCLRLNDPSANVYLPDENEELWSAIMINESDERLYNNTQYKVNVENYNINSKVYEDRMKENQKNFNLLIDKKVVTRFEFTNVTGLHSVTSVWCEPDGTLFDVSENVLFTPEGEENKPIIMWFWIDLNEENRTYKEGLWAMKLFIDGEFILEDIFNISKIAAYSSKGRVYSV